MVRLLKQSTAKTLRFGPFVDSTDGNTEETGLTISQADIRLSKNGGAFAQTNDASGATHDEKGWYYLQLDATDTNTLGPLTVNIHESGALPVWADFLVVPGNIYDSLVSGSDYLDISLVQWLGTAPLALSSQQVRAVVPSTQKVDVETIKTRAVTCAAGVTVGAYVGGTAAQDPEI